MTSMSSTKLKNKRENATSQEGKEETEQGPFTKRQDSCYLLEYDEPLTLRAGG
jgi:hypothetical protein